MARENIFCWLIFCPWSRGGGLGKHARERTGRRVKWQLAWTGAPSILITIWLNLKTNQPDQPDTNKNKLFFLQAIVNSCPRLDVLFKAKGSFVLVKISKLFTIADIWKWRNIKEGHLTQLQGKFSATRNHPEANAQAGLPMQYTHHLQERHRYFCPG